MNYSFKKVFIAGCLGILSFGMTMITVGSLLPELIDKFSLNNLQAGFITSLLPIGILGGSLLFGPLVDRYGYKWLMIFSVLAEAIGVVMLGLGNELYLIHAGVPLLAFGGGLLNGATNGLIADISKENKSANLSFLGVFYGVGALSMPFILGLFGKFFHFSEILTFIGAGLLFICVYCFLVAFPKPKQEQGFPLAEGGKLLGKSVILFCGLALAFGTAVEGITNNWLTTYFRENNLGTVNEGLYYLSMMVLALTLTRLFLGIILKRFNPFGIMIFFAQFMGAGFLLIYWGGSLAVLIGVIFIGMGTAGNVPILLSYTAQLFPKLSGTAFGIIFTFALTGNTLANIFMGQIAEYYTINYMPLFGFGLFLMMVLFMYLFKYSQKNYTPTS